MVEAADESGLTLGQLVERTVAELHVAVVLDHRLVATGT
jgi:hypothetical protein